MENSQENYEEKKLLVLPDVKTTYKTLVIKNIVVLVQKKTDNGDRPLDLGELI